MAILNVESLQIVKDIKKNFHIFNEEFFNLIKFEKEFQPKMQSVTVFNEVFYTGKIQACSLKTDEKLLDLNEYSTYKKNELQVKEKIQSRLKICPFHDNFFTKNHQVRQIYYNIMHPKSLIRPHYGVNGKARNMDPNHFRIQFTVAAGTDAYFFIENHKPIHYVNGLCFGFEDGLVNHWAENKGTDTRIVMIVDIHKENVLPLPLLEY